MFVGVYYSHSSPSCFLFESAKDFGLLFLALQISRNFYFDFLLTANIYRTRAIILKKVQLKLSEIQNDFLLSQLKLSLPVNYEYPKYLFETCFDVFKFFSRISCVFPLQAPPHA